MLAVGVLGNGMLLVQTTEDGPDVDDELPLTLTELQDSIRRIIGTTMPLGEPVRLSRYTFTARQAQHYRDRRIMVAGDAAHQFPATGIGLNVGMLDAVNLAWKLAADLRGRAPADLLDTYHRERHFAGLRTMLQAQAQVALRRGSDPAADALRELFRELLLDEQPVRRVAAIIAGTDVRYPGPNPDQHPLTGTFAADLTLHTDLGTTSVAELMHTARPVFLDLADRPDLRDVAREWQDRVDIHTAKADDQPADALLIRPDADHRLGRDRRPHLAARRARLLVRDQAHCPPCYLPCCRMSCSLAALSCSRKSVMSASLLVGVCRQDAGGRGDQRRDRRAVSVSCRPVDSTNTRRRSPPSRTRRTKPRRSNRSRAAVVADVLSPAISANRLAVRSGTLRAASRHFRSVMVRPS